MTRFLLVALAATLLVGISAAQHGLQPEGSAAAQSTPSPARSLTVTGRVSADGRNLLTDLDSEWAISNAEALRGREGKLVTVKCYVEPDRNHIHVLAVRSGAVEDRYASRLGDSAFRR